MNIFSGYSVNVFVFLLVAPWDICSAKTRDLGYNQRQGLRRRLQSQNERAGLLSLSPREKQNKPFIRYHVDRERFYSGLFAAHDYSCPNFNLSKGWWSETLASSTWVQTNLKILVVGDSVGIQMGAILEEAIKPFHRDVLHYSWRRHVGVSASATIDGGVVSAWRTTGLMRPSTRDHAGPNARGGGWNAAWMEELLNWTIPHPPRKQEKEGVNNEHAKSQKIGGFDVVVMRPPAPGWMDPGSVTTELLLESLSIIPNVMNCSRVILMTSHFQNNVRTAEQYDEFLDMNNRIRNLVAAHARNKSVVPGLDHLTLLDVGQWTGALLETNAREIGLLNNATATSKPGDFLLRLSGGRFTPSIAQVCAEKVPSGSKECKRNPLYYDGMHWCVETLGGRFVAGMSCVVDCLYPSNNKNEDSVQHCVQECNDRFMSQRSLDEIMDSGTALVVS